MSSQTLQSWQTWDAKTFAAFNGQVVDVRRVGGEIVLTRGRVCKHTDMLGGPGILQYGHYGLDDSGQSVVAALAAPVPPIWPSLPKRSSHQTSMREGVFLRERAIESLRLDMHSIFHEWKKSTDMWLQQYEFRVTD